MDSRELRILKEIEASAYEDDAAFAELLAGGPRLSVGYKLGLALATSVGLALLMSFSASLLLGLAGYLILVAAGTNLLRKRAVKPAQDSPLELFHRLTAGLLRNPDTAFESSYE
jgi:hypothetical protein